MKNINNALLHIKAKHNGEIPYQYGSGECAKLMDSYAKEYHQETTKHPSSSKEVDEVKKQKITMSPKGGCDEIIFEAEVLLHHYDIDGSQIIVLKTDKRENVERFLHDELISK